MGPRPQQKRDRWNGQYQLRAVALHEGLRCKKKLWRETGRQQLESFQLAPWASQRRRDLLELLDQLNPTIAMQAAEQQPEVQRPMTHPGVGPITARAFVLILGVPERFPCGKQVGSYLGLIPCEESTGGRQRLGHISKQGNTLLRFLLIESAHAVVRYDPEWRRFLQLAMRRGRPIAKVAMARRLAVRLYWMWRKAWDYQQTLKFGSQLLTWAIAARVLRFFIAPTYDDSKGACSPPWCPSRSVRACCSKAEGSRSECPVLYLLFDSLLAPNPEEDLTPLLEESGRLARLKPRGLRR
jgi:hypothetical protein